MRIVQVSDTGLYSLRLCTDPFLCSATTVAVFQILGIHLSEAQYTKQHHNNVHKRTILT